MKRIFITLLCSATIFAANAMQDISIEGLNNAIKGGHVNDVRIFLNKVIDSEPSGSRGVVSPQAKTQTGIHISSKNVPAALSQHDRLLTQALMQAIRAGNFDIVHMLVTDFNADINSKKGIREDFQLTPLGLAKSLRNDDLNSLYIIGFLQRENARE